MSMYNAFLLELSCICALEVRDKLWPRPRNSGDLHSLLCYFLAT